MKKIAFIFPGQGSQRVGMGSELYKNSSLAKQIFDEANNSLNFDLQKICFEGPEETLKLTQNGQPAILTTSILCYLLFQEQMPITPVLAAGHSLGEYTALVAAGVLSFKDAVQAVHYRGIYMQEAVPAGQGGMAAILGTPVDKLEEICQEESQPDNFVLPVNYNSPQQIVIAGHIEALNRVLSKVKGKQLPVSAPFHSPLMQPAAHQLAKKLKEYTFNDPAYPIICNASNTMINQKDQFYNQLIEQMTAPVRWTQIVDIMIQQGVNTMIEFGEGNVLTGLMKRIDKTIQTYNVSSIETLHSTIEQLQ